VIRKPFEVADLGNLVWLCVNGFDAAKETLPGVPQMSNDFWLRAERGSSN
jgi:hypothetical protein